jgi:hypothetical protein
MPEISNPPTDILASLLASFGTKPAKVARKSLPKNAKPIPLPQHVAWNLKKTGYREWKATARIVVLQEQICSCCGNSIQAVQQELYELENTTAHSIWHRPEGFGINAQEDLPIRYTQAEPRRVIACAFCKSIDLDEAILAEVRASMQLTFPF